MNTLELRTRIEPESEENGDASLVTMIFIDGEPLTTDDCIDISELDRSTRNDGNFFIITCGCGDAGCAGMFEGVHVFRNDHGVYWKIIDTEPTRSFVFNQQAYAEAIERGIGELRDMHREHQIGTTPDTNEWYLEEMRKAWRWTPEGSLLANKM